MQAVARLVYAIFPLMNSLIVAKSTADMLIRMRCKLRGERVAMVYPRAGNVWPFITNSRNDINNNSIAFILRYEEFSYAVHRRCRVAAEQRFLNEGIDLHANVPSRSV